jgi:hypothetical protein
MFYISIGMKLVTTLILLTGTLSVALSGTILGLQNVKADQCSGDICTKEQPQIGVKVKHKYWTCHYTQQRCPPRSGDYRQEVGYGKVIIWHVTVRP